MPDMKEIQSKTEEQALETIDTVKTPQQIDIPNEIQLEILSRLPGKSLARFNTVSHLWYYSFITTAFLSHHSRSPVDENNVYMCGREFFYFPSDSLTDDDEEDDTNDDHPINDNNEDNDDDDEYEDEDEDEDEDHGYGYDYGHGHGHGHGLSQTITGFRVPLGNLPRTFVSTKRVAMSNFCDGLICMFVNWNYLRNMLMLLFSVRTNDFLVIPTKSDNVEVLYDRTCYVGRLLLCSLGFDPVGREYKLMRIISGENCLKYEILTVGSKTSKSWKPIDHDHVPPLLCQGLPYEGSFCLHGVIYWIHEYGDLEDDGLIRLVIACFDLASGEFKAFEVDEIVGWSYNFKSQIYLTPMNGCPTLFVKLIQNDWVVEISQWTLSEHPNAVWTKSLAASHIAPHLWPRDCQCVGSNITLDWLEPLMYYCHDLNSGKAWRVQVDDEEHDRDHVLEIGGDMGYYVTSSA